MNYIGIVLTSFILLTHGFAAVAQELNMMSKLASGEPVYHAETSEISFSLLRHKIAVPVFLNDEPNEYVFVLDTGALTLIAEHVASKLELEKGQSIPTMDEDEKAYLTKLKSIKIGQMEVQDFIIPRMDLQAVFDSTFRFAGFIGSDYLRFFRATIDYQNRLLTLSQRADTTGPSACMQRIPMDAPLPMRFPYIDVTVNDSIRTRAMIDTGSPFALVMPLSFEEQLCGPLLGPCITSVGALVKWPSTDPPYNCLTRLKTVSIGELVVRDLPIILTDLPMMVGTPLLGKGFLDKYVTVLDYPGRHVFLCPLADRDHETNVFSTGVALKRRGDDAYVSGFWKDSPAGLSELEHGDRIVEVNGIDARSLSQEDIDAVLDDDSVTTIHLGIKGEEKVTILTLEKTWLLPTPAGPTHRPVDSPHQHD
jgi:predicted aspartyl protease